MSQNLYIQSHESIQQYLQQLYQPSHSFFPQQENYLELSKKQIGKQNNIKIQIQKNQLIDTLKARDFNSQLKETKLRSDLLNFKQKRLKPKIVKPLNSQVKEQSINSYSFKSPKSQNAVIENASKLLQTKSNTCEKQKQSKTTDTFFSGSNSKVRKISGRWQKNMTLANFNSLDTKEASQFGGYQSFHQSLAESNIYLLSQVNYQKELLEKQKSICNSTKKTTKKLDQICNNLRQKNKKLVGMIEEMTKKGDGDCKLQYFSLIKESQRLEKQNQNLRIKINQKNQLIEYLQRKIYKKNKNIELLKYNASYSQIQSQIQSYYAERLLNTINEIRERSNYFKSSLFMSFDSRICDDFKILCQQSETKPQRNYLEELIQIYQQISQLFLINCESQKSCRNIKNRVTNSGNQNGCFYSLAEEKILLNHQLYQIDKNKLNEYQLKLQSEQKILLDDKKNSIQRIENINMMITQALSKLRQKPKSQIDKLC